MTTNQIHKYLELLKRVKDAHLSNQESIEVLEELLKRQKEEWKSKIKTKKFKENKEQCNLM